MKTSIPKITGLLVLCAILSELHSRAEFPQFRWLVQSGGVLSQTATALGVDSSTNAYVAGFFNSSATIGSTTLTNTYSFSNVFLAQFNMNGVPQWVKSPAIDYPISEVKLVSGGSLTFLAGNFGGTNLTFGSQSITNYDPSTHLEDIFLVAHNVNGNLNWLRQAGGTGEDTVKGVVVDSTGNSYIVGWFQSPTFFIDNTNLVLKSTNRDCFIVKYNTSGSVVWARQGTNASGNVVAMDQANNCYVAGTDFGSAAFDGIVATNPTTGNFVIKYNSAGTPLWARGDINVGSRMAVDRAQNIFTAGTFTGSLQFDATILSNDSPATIYVARYDNAGNFLWARQLPGLGYDQVTGIMLDYRTNCWISGYFASVDAGQPVNPALAVACFDRNGNLLGASSAGGARASMGTGIATFQGMANYMCGSFATNITLSGTNLTSVDESDILVGRLNPAPPPFNSTATNNNLIMSWANVSQVFSNVTLETMTDSFSTNWVAATNPSVVVGGQTFVTNNFNGDSRFFRLRLEPK